MYGRVNFRHKILDKSTRLPSWQDNVRLSMSLIGKQLEIVSLYLEDIRHTAFDLLSTLDPSGLLIEVGSSEEETVCWIREDIFQLVESPLRENADEEAFHPLLERSFDHSSTLLSTTALRYLLTWILFLNYRSDNNTEYRRIFSEYLREHFELSKVSFLFL
eukprot:jgi/Galph1/815/GphlegSOOS_G5512.1